MTATVARWAALDAVRRRFAAATLIVATGCDGEAVDVVGYNRASADPVDRVMVTAGPWVDFGAVSH